MVLAVSESNVKNAHRKFLSDFIVNYYFSQSKKARWTAKIITKFAKLVEKMEQNSDIARGFPDVGKTKLSINEFWKELAVELNEAPLNSLFL